MHCVDIFKHGRWLQLDADLQVHGKAVTVPGRALAGIISNLKANLEPEAFELLQTYHQMVVSNLRVTSSPDTSSSAEVPKTQQELADKLTGLKALASITVAMNDASN